MTAVAGAVFCCCGLWPMTLRMAMMATYPQAIPKASENKIVNRTVVEANSVLIVQIYSDDHCEYPVCLPGTLNFHLNPVQSLHYRRCWPQVTHHAPHWLRAQDNLSHQFAEG